jgi:hypothetical protein
LGAKLAQGNNWATFWATPICPSVRTVTFSALPGASGGTGITSTIL